MGHTGSRQLREFPTTVFEWRTQGECLMGNMFVDLAWQLEFDPHEPCKGRRRQLTPQGGLLTATLMLCTLRAHHVHT